MVIRKCEVVQDCVCMSRKLAADYKEITHKIELKELQGVQSSEGLRETNSKKYHSK